MARQDHRRWTRGVHEVRSLLGRLRGARGRLAATGDRPASERSKSERDVREALASLKQTARPLIAFEHTRVVFGPQGAALGVPDFESNAANFDLLTGEHGYRLFDLDGVGPLTKQEFRGLYETAERFNFIAVPS